MRYRELGKTGLTVSEIGFGGEWLERHEVAEGAELIRYAGEKGINIINCWMADPKSRDAIGQGIAGNREKWYVQGHIGSTWQNNQYVRTRDMAFVKPAFEDLLQRLGTDYIDLGMIHYVDAPDDWEKCMASPFLDYVLALKEAGTIRHIGLSTHNPRIATMAVGSGIVEMMMFSINPAFDMHPVTENIDDMFEDYAADWSGIDEERAALYRLCEEKGIGLTVMKPYFGGRLFDAARSPFGVTFTPAQCIHYALTRPAAVSALCGYDTKEQIDMAVAYETATEEEKDYASLIASAPLHAYSGQCTYCGHCKPCPMEIDIPMVNKFYDLASTQPSVPESVRAHYEALDRKASDCIGCRGCEERCPFGVAVAERMEKAAQLFGR